MFLFCLIYNIILITAAIALLPVILAAGGAVLLAAVLGIVLWKMKAKRGE